VALRSRPKETWLRGDPVLVTIHGRVYRGVLRGRSWSDEHRTWRWDVEISIDDRRVLTTVSADQIQRLHDPERTI
jgi:hypothetical protein